MKALFTSCLASLLMLTGAPASHAEAPLAIANFSVERGLSFSLTLDGQPLTRLQAQQVHLDTLAPGQHQVELDLAPATARSRRPQHVQATVWLEEGLETTFVLTQRPGFGWQLRQVSTVALPGYGYADQAGTYAQPAPEAAYNAPPTEAGYPPAAGPGYPAPPAYPAGAGYHSQPAYPAVTPAYPAAPAYPAGAYVPNSDVAGLVEALKQCSFDDKRLPLFYQAISRSYVRADDLALMVRTMTYSDSQRQVAEFGYGHLSDPQNFNRVLAALTFSTDALTILDNLGLQRR